MQCRIEKVLTGKIRLFSLASALWSLLPRLGVLDGERAG
jgi:hypothetical protein